MLAMFICNVVDIKVLKLNNEPWEFLQQQETHTLSKVVRRFFVGGPPFLRGKNKMEEQRNHIKEHVSSFFVAI